MPAKSPTDKLLPSLTTWELTDLLDLQAALAGLIEAQKPKKLEQNSHQGKVDMATSPEAKQARGHIEAKYVPRGNKMHGPYLYLRYWQGGKLRSKYLGKPQQT